MSNDSKKSFNEAITRLLEQNLTKYVGKDLDHALSLQMYTTIFDTLVGVFNQSNVGLSNEAVNFIAQSYYDCVSLNASSDLGPDPTIFTKRADLKEISTAELGFVMTLFKDEPLLAAPVIKEIKGRS